MKNTSRTDWKRLSEMKDEDIDTSDIPELNEEFFRKAHINLPPKQSVRLDLDTDVLNWFKSQGQGYQIRINTLLRSYMERHQQHR